MTTRAELEQEFLTGLRQAGLAVPQDRYALMFEAFLAWRDLVGELHRPLPYDAEPAALWVPEQPTPRRDP